MSAVAKEARVSKTTLYARFPSKADLFRAIVAAQTESWNSGIYHRPAADQKTLAEELRGYGDIMLRAGTSDDFIQLNRLLYSESARFPELGEIARSRFELGVRYLTGRISLYAERDGVPCRDPAAAAELFLMTVTGWNSTVVLTNRTVRGKDWNVWLDRAVAMLIRGRTDW